MIAEEQIVRVEPVEGYQPFEIQNDDVPWANGDKVALLAGQWESTITRISETMAASVGRD